MPHFYGKDTLHVKIIEILITLFFEREDGIQDAFTYIKFLHFFHYLRFKDLLPFANSSKVHIFLKYVTRRVLRQNANSIIKY